MRIAAYLYMEDDRIATCGECCAGVTSVLILRHGLGASLDMSGGARGQLPMQHVAVWHPGEKLTPLEEERCAHTAAGNVVDLGKGPLPVTAMRA
jgi:hypothetical protein